MRTKVLVLWAILTASGCAPAFGQTDVKPEVKPDLKVAFPFIQDDRVAWVGSSSTNIGVWPKTMQFLLNTRHPELRLTFGKFTTGGGTFATGIDKMDEWLTPFKPTVVFFNYGGNDASAGEKGLDKFKKNMEAAFEKARGHGVTRIVFFTPQNADIRKAKGGAGLRALYSDTMRAFCREKGWMVINVHTPLGELQASGQKDDDAYTILTDTIHLTTPAYIAWGYFAYDSFVPPAPESLASLAADGTVVATTNCKIAGVKADANGVTFQRTDAMLPILPPQPLPPRKYVPLEKLSRYMLKVKDLPAGDYTVKCEGMRMGDTTAMSLADGVNLNTLLLDNGEKAPWEKLSKQWWDGKNLEAIGRTTWTFEVRKKS